MHTNNEAYIIIRNTFAIYHLTYCNGMFFVEPLFSLNGIPRFYGKTISETLV
jgi:hypothetical protein